jgi:hypothetical protein
MVYQALNDTTPFDEYYLNSYERIRCPKPELPLTDFWKKLIRHLEITRDASWVECACTILNVTFQKQGEVSIEVSKITKGLRKRKTGYAPLFVIDPDREVSLLFVFYAGLRPKIEDIAKSEMSTRNVNRAVVIEIDANKPNLVTNKIYGIGIPTEVGRMVLIHENMQPTVSPSGTS